ncbi:CDP-diacylglycerol--glycerol-3-phosphate 3-phosphatidyltransferase [Rhodovulum imhoffii]|uniref:CDP-diacylglycerol--glycerol-3-phosphate 3-phosphatidyltransferase n=1 Tax=Rhodovulum imhoffii TaxID=365340 RepID=A0A2T5BSL6_9RHOB|nr:CDP-diacylglycerol--glycerol-3-phosphate 3-phosphatidyltransferase [Rhodovulum imhoffii]MBK5933021.1 CDP-diacylglycerol--glycerol-3-phosphate 3-phosphatidyltransferase [Rhodovulum imhoffii]PTN02339.1 CDP-diacylglycerol--glycerol-3-phosphate 3-phosphatidyltransferase [Rhodovulum imhoffii]
MTWTLPNILTVFRLLAAPGLALAFVLLPRPEADLWALVLFAGASVTDWLDGYLARKWNQTSRFGAMLDPIADKAMVVIALGTLMALWGANAWLMVPATAILFREVFVSGLREFLGTQAGLLKVTKLAKWKTTVQMVAVSVLLAQGLLGGWLAGLAQWGGFALLWAAGALTLLTGWDYFAKALPFLRERE